MSPWRHLRHPTKDLVESGCSLNKQICSLSIFWEGEPIQSNCDGSECIREGNGNPLKYSCLENPRGAWWACCLWGRTGLDTTEATQQQQQQQQQLVSRFPQLNLFSQELGLIMVSNVCSINPFSVIYIKPSQSGLAVSYQVDQQSHPREVKISMST